MSSEPNLFIQRKLGTDNDSAANNQKPKIRFDGDYIKTLPALVKMAEVIICVVCLICVNTIYNATHHSSGSWYYFVSMTGLLASLLFLIFYTFHVVERFQWFPWHGAEMGYAGLWALFYGIADLVAITRASLDPAWGALTVFGAVALCIYGYEAFTKFQKWKKGDSPQGEIQAADAESTAAANQSAN